MLFAESVTLWRNLTLFGAFPAIGLVGIYVYLEHQEEEKHHTRPEFKKMEYMYIRTRVSKASSHDIFNVVENVFNETIVNFPSVLSSVIGVLKRLFF